MMFKDNFSNNERYKLFRNMYEIIHPTISKKNISNYKIVFDEGILPVRVFYPKRLANLSSVVIYVPGEGNISNCYGEYENILKDMAINLDKLVIAIDYFDEEIKYPYIFDKIYNCIDFIINELGNNNILSGNIVLMGDSFGSNLVSGITLKRIDEDKVIDYKEVLFYPIISGEYYGKSKYESLNRDGIVEKEDLALFGGFIKKYISNKKRLSDKYICPFKNKDFSSYPDTFILTADLDILRDEGKSFSDLLISCNEKSMYYNLLFSEHGFLDFSDIEVKEEIYNKIKEFLNS